MYNGSGCTEAIWERMASSETYAGIAIKLFQLRVIWGAAVRRVNSNRIEADRCLVKMRVKSQNNPENMRISRNGCTGIRCQIWLREDKTNGVRKETANTIRDKVKRLPEKKEKGDSKTMGRNQLPILSWRYVLVSRMFCQREADFSILGMPMPKYLEIK